MAEAAGGRGQARVLPMLYNQQRHCRRLSCRAPRPTRARHRLLSRMRRPHHFPAIHREADIVRHRLVPPIGPPTLIAALATIPIRQSTAQTTITLLDYRTAVPPKWMTRVCLQPGRRRQKKALQRIAVELLGRAGKPPRIGRQRVSIRSSGPFHLRCPTTRRGVPRIPVDSAAASSRA